MSARNLVFIFGCGTLTNFYPLAVTPVFNRLSDPGFSYLKTTAETKAIRNIDENINFDIL